MKNFVLILSLALIQACSFGQKPPSISVDVLAIGNAHYREPGPFQTIEDVNFSASAFLNCFKKFSTPCIMQSRATRLLSKKKMLDAIKSFVDFVENQKTEQRIGIIYYCGHGMANLAGSMYFVPGDIDCKVQDTTFEYLSNQLLNVDEIKKIIIEAQEKDNGTSSYVILGDCCSSQASSKWYEGIKFSFMGDSMGVISYDSSFLSKKINSGLLRSAELTVDDLKNDTPKHQPDTLVASGINEFDFIPELIRSITFTKNGNLIYYSSPMGVVTEMVDYPLNKDNPDNYDVGPICRRTTLFFSKKENTDLINYFMKLKDPDFDRKTKPALLNASRNSADAK